MTDLRKVSMFRMMLCSPDWGGGVGGGGCAGVGGGGEGVGLCVN